MHSRQQLSHICERLAHMDDDQPVCAALKGLFGGVLVSIPKYAKYARYCYMGMQERGQNERIASR